MKYVIGVIPATALENVTQALGKGGIYRLTVAEVEVIDPAAAELPGSEERHLRLEVGVNDSFLQPALDAFDAIRSRGEDAWVSVLPLEDVIRIRTGERGPEAI